MPMCHVSGDTVFIQGAAATPIELVKAMVEFGKSCGLKDVTVCHMHTEGEAGYTEPECQGMFRSLSFFMAKNVRKPIAEGRSDCIPIFLQDIPKLFHRKIVKPTVCLIQVSPPDEHGYCSTGTSVDCVRAALMYSKYVVGEKPFRIFFSYIIYCSLYLHAAQVNPQMPRTFGDSQIHQSHFDYAVKVDVPLPEHGGAPPNEVERKIGSLIAENLVEDGATLQLGIGSIPDAVLAALANHKDLGVHSEMFAAGTIPLFESGAITNNKKVIHQGKTIGSFLIGTRALYDFVDNNPSIG
ncbi:hypothetical protein PR048_030210 [Dryococelus australis]|uniref:Acetyl-CoA hydrolase/transferase N-terminal domain-containing protein n=1 Tax=Dryococelus australis TaxID=614101 RepID=A0ABQ9G8B3_9NEOP|nr:hypothetical protein PR048_030210 [Dryococelus australis]